MRFALFLITNGAARSSGLLAQPRKPATCLPRGALFPYASSIATSDQPRRFSGKCEGRGRQRDGGAAELFCAGHAREPTAGAGTWAAESRAPRLLRFTCSHLGMSPCRTLRGAPPHRAVRLYPDKVRLPQKGRADHCLHWLAIWPACACAVTCTLDCLPDTLRSRRSCTQTHAMAYTVYQQENRRNSSKAVDRRQ
jgi:hypothetical protein